MNPIVWPILCALSGNNINAKADNFISAGYGLCYHYDSYNYSIRYEFIQVQAVLMQPARWRTMRMQPEQYVIPQYYIDNKRIDYYGGIGIKIGGGMVTSAVGKYKLNKHLSSSLGYYKLTNMSHIVLGLNVEL
jgi:hypothetical protein